MSQTMWIVTGNVGIGCAGVWDSLEAAQLAVQNLCNTLQLPFTNWGETTGVTWELQGLPEGTDFYIVHCQLNNWTAQC